MAVIQTVRIALRDAAEFAKNSPEPDQSQLWTDVYNV